MYQILKFRTLKGGDLLNPIKTGYNDKLIVENFEDLLQGKFLETIPEEERYNIVASLELCHPEGKKDTKFYGQEILPIDIDDIKDSSIKREIFEVVCTSLLLNPEEVGCIDTGNGIHILIKIPLWTRPDFFDHMKEAYSCMCDMLQMQLQQNALQGKIDKGIFSRNKTTRLPGTRNDKTHLGKGVRIVSCISDKMVLQKDFNLESFMALDVIKANAVKGYGSLDVASILSCPFLEYAKENAARLSEPEWHAMIGVLAFVPEGEKLCHEYSSAHSGYRPEDVEQRITRALKLSGPRKCESIAQIFGGCASCPHQTRQNNLTTPLQIRSEDFIATEKTGFHKITPSGKVIPEYYDLAKFMYKQSPFYFSDTGIFKVYSPQKKIWVELKESVINTFAAKHFNPKPVSATCKEFVEVLKREYLKTEEEKLEELEEFTQGEHFINMANGVLRISDKQLVPHSHKFFFESIIDYDYDPEARAPIYEKTLMKILGQNVEDCKLWNEFVGVGLAGIPSKIVQKCMILLGEGSNGKSTLIDTVEYLVSKEFCSTMSFKDIADGVRAAHLRGKLFNISGEMGRGDFEASDIFKKVIVGEAIPVHKMHVDKTTEVFNAKMIMAANKLPKSQDNSNGFYRRILILRLKQTFKETDADFDREIGDKLFAERSGILNIVLEHFGYWLARGKKFTSSRTADKTMTEMQEENDNVRSFMNDMVELASDAVVAKDTLYKTYQEYCRDNNDKYVLKKQTFCKRIPEIHSKIEAVKATGLDFSGKKRVHAFRGIRIIGRFSEGAF